MYASPEGRLPLLPLWRKTPVLATPRAALQIQCQGMAVLLDGGTISPGEHLRKPQSELLHLLIVSGHGPGEEHLIGDAGHGSHPAPVG